MHIITSARIQWTPVSNWLHLKAWNLWRYEPVVDNVTGLIVSTKTNSQTTLSGVSVMVMAHVNTVAMNYGMFVNSFAMNTGKTTQIHSWWYEQITGIDQAQRNSDPPRAYISVVNESTERFFSLLTLCISPAQWLLTPVQQYNTTARPQLTLFTYFQHHHLPRSGKS